MTRENKYTRTFTILAENAKLLKNGMVTVEECERMMNKEIQSFIFCHPSDLDTRISYERRLQRKALNLMLSAIKD